MSSLSDSSLHMFVVADWLTAKRRVFLIGACIVKRLKKDGAYIMSR